MTPIPRRSRRHLSAPAAALTAAASGGLSRRALLGTGVAAGAGLALTGCAPPSPPSGGVASLKLPEDLSERDAIIEGWLAEHAEGTAVVIGDPSYVESARVRSLTPELAKGLEFDLVVLVDPDRFGEGVTGAVDRYVAMTRATQRLVVLTS